MLVGSSPRTPPELQRKMSARPWLLLGQQATHHEACHLTKLLQLVYCRNPFKTLTSPNVKITFAFSL